MSNTDDKWKSLDEKLQKYSKQAPVKVPVPNDPIAPVGLTVAPSGVVEKFKDAHIQKKARLEALRIKSRGALEVWGHKVKSQVVLEKKRIDVQVESELEHIWRDHLDNLREVGISNFEDRSRALMELTRRSVEQLNSIESMDAPKQLKEKVVDAVLKGYCDLFDRIQSDEVSDSSQSK